MTAVLSPQGITRDPLHLPATATLEQLQDALAALANHQGGTLLLAAAADGDALVERVLEAALTLDPALIVPLPRISAGSVLVEVPAGMPHVYTTGAGRYLTRDGERIVPLLMRDLRRLMLQRGEIAFESNPVEGAARDDLDWHKAADYAARLPGFGAANAEELLLQRGCLVPVAGMLRPTNAGLLLFGRDPQRFLRSAFVTAVHYDTDLMSDTHRRMDFTGTLVDQIRRMETFLTTHLRRAVTMGDGMARQEEYEYPMEAARELIINAVAHRDYSIQGDNIRVLLFASRFEVHSPGGLPGYMTLDNLRDERFSRNPVIVQVLSDLLYIERLGYGVDRVMELMQAQRMRAPEFVEGAGSFRATLYNARDAAPTRPAEGTILHKYQQHDLNPRQERALALLHASPTARLTNSDLQSEFKEIHSETIRRDLVDLVRRELIVKMGEKRGSYYVLRTDE